MRLYTTAAVLGAVCGIKNGRGTRRVRLVLVPMWRYRRSWGVEKRAEVPGLPADLGEDKGLPAV